MTEAASPLVYGYAQKELPVYFNQAMVMTVSAAGFDGGREARAAAAQAQNITPMRGRPLPRPTRRHLQPLRGRRAAGGGGDAEQINASFGSALPTSHGRRPADAASAHSDGLP